MPKEIYPREEITSTSSVRLLGRTQAPIDQTDLTPEYLETLNSSTIIAGEAARTCYSPTLHPPQDYLIKSDKYRSVTNEVVQSTKESGHLTTRQHVHYTFALEGVSRHAINFLHSQPHYNSEEVSQRYVNFKETSPIIPQLDSEKLNQEAQEIARNLIESYDTLRDLLLPTAKTEILKRFPARNNPKWEKDVQSEAGKKAQEVARYLLPLGTPTNLYFTVSELTLIRLHHLKNTLPAQPEISNLIDAMVATVAQVDPSIVGEVGNSIPRRTETADQIISNYQNEFDELIFDNNVQLDQADQNIGASLARSVRLVLGASKDSLPDAEAVSLLLDPSKNKLLTSVYGEIVLDHLSQCLNQVNISALVSLSHTANYQLHRHRGFNHTTPLLLGIPDFKKDIVIPALLYENQEALDFYLQTTQKHLDSLQKLSAKGVSLEDLQYLLPNSTRVRKSISGPLGAFYHFIKSRTCLTAQEEIYNIAVSLAKQLAVSNPKLSGFLDSPAPCGVRSRGGIKPQCPEGKRYCGVRVWDLTLDQYPKRTI
jgi:flavin-dependent thymidylate synthase